jgi:hypothetical protein
MHSADLTFGRSVRKTPRGYSGANTFVWGMCTKLLQNRGQQLRSTVRAEPTDAADGRRPHYPPTTGEGRS